MLAFVLALKIAAAPCFGASFLCDGPNISLESGVLSGGQIVVGKVREIKTQGIFKVATLDVERTLKGKPVRQIRFRANGFNSCDGSNAELGERILLITDPKNLHRRVRHLDLSDADRRLLTQIAEIGDDGGGRFVIEKGRIPVYKFGKGPAYAGYDLPVRIPFRPEGGNKGSIAERDLIRYVTTALRDSSPEGLLKLDSEFGPCATFDWNRSGSTSIPIDEAVGKVGLIVVGKVREIETSDKLRIAVLDVEQTLKGSPAKEVRFLASSLGNGDRSWAEVSQRVVLFLNPATNDPRTEKLNLPISDLYLIDRDGTGRLIVQDGRVSLSEFDGTLMADDYEFPRHFPRQREARFSATILERDLVSSVRKAVAKGR